MDTIFAVSSGGAPSGVAVIRVSGQASALAIEAIAARLPRPREAVLRTLRHPVSGDVLDQGLVLWFPGPASFTGEDSAEFHVHGGAAVIAAMLEALGSLAQMRLAEPGEFARRAFLNGKLDLTGAEGLSDLISAETEAQRRQAVAQAGGELRRRLDGWRDRIIAMRASIEAGFDFSDEDGVPADVGADAFRDAGILAGEIGRFLDDGHRGEIVRSGFQIVLMGEPNSGKSSLLNALARRNAAIVSPEAGTTRDIIEVSLDLGGYRVVLVDTAGMREAVGAVEREGIRRAQERAGMADLVVWLNPADGVSPPLSGLRVPVLEVRSKDDSGTFRFSGISVKREGGLDWLLAELGAKVANRVGGAEPAPVSRFRHRQSLSECVDQLQRAAAGDDLAPEIRSEFLRSAGDALGRVTGRIDVEDLLGEIFSAFCIGK